MGGVLGRFRPRPRVTELPAGRPLSALAQGWVRPALLTDCGADPWLERS